MQFDGQITKDTLRQIRDNLPNVSQNQQIYDSITNMLAKKTIQPVPYSYTANFAVSGAASALAAGATLTVNINIQADADFLILNQTYDVNSNNSAKTASNVNIPNIGILMTDTGSGYQMMDAAVPVAEIFGNGQFPYVLPNPKLLPAKATLQIIANNFEQAQAYNLRLAFNGVKLYSFN